jgi:hypothetical protein
MALRLAPLLSVLLGASLVFSACGGSSASQEELDRARKQGAAQARQQSKIEQIERQLRALKKGNASNGSNAQARAPESTDVSPCGEEPELYVGPNTTCGFAANVRSDYYGEIGSGSGTVDSYSPTTGNIYSMYCTAGAPHVCTGGNNASVYFP